MLVVAVACLIVVAIVLLLGVSIRVAKIEKSTEAMQKVFNNFDFEVNNPD